MAKKKPATKNQGAPKPVTTSAAGEPVGEVLCTHPRCMGMVNGNGCAEKDCQVAR